MAEKDDSFLGGKEAGLLIGFSRDTIETWATPLEDEQVPSKIRYLEAVLDKGAKPVCRYFKQDVLAFLRRPEWSKYSNGLGLSDLAEGQGRGLWRLLRTISGGTQLCTCNKSRQLTPDGFGRGIVLKLCSLTLNGVQKVVSSNLTAPTIFIADSRLTSSGGEP